MDKLCGVYKITSPSNRVYIGQSRDIGYRFKTYLKEYPMCKNQVVLNRSFNKYGVKNHTFEIIEECPIELLNKRERYWQDYYDVLNGGLNCLLTSTEDLPLVFSKEVLQKMSISATNKVVSKETKILLSEIHKGSKNHFFGKNIQKSLKIK